MKFTIYGFTVLLVFVFANAPRAQTAANEKDLPNFSQVNRNFYRGAQPTENGVKQLARMGVRTIIDLRGADENSEREKSWAQSAGIKFVAVDLSNWFKPKTSDIEAIIKQIDAPENQPVFVHCKRGADRTGTVAAIYRIKHDGWTAKQAIAEAKRFDFGWWQFWMKDYINDYYEKFKVQS